MSVSGWLTGLRSRRTDGIWTWPGGPLPDPRRENAACHLEGIWLSPLSLSVRCRTVNGASFLRSDRPFITLLDGSRVEPGEGRLLVGEGTVEEWVWEFESPVDLQKAASVTLLRETISLSGN